MFPRARHRTSHHDPDAFRFIAFYDVLRPRAFQGALVTDHHLLEHVSGGYARKIRAAGGRAKRQREPNKIVIRIADHRLIKIANLHMNLTVRGSEWTQIARMAVSTNPNGRPFRN